MKAAIIITLISLCYCYNIAPVSAHGYLKTPRSRNLVAYQDKDYETPIPSDPLPEDCPHCLNRGGTLAQCGISSGMTNGIPILRNYDNPQTINNQPMSSNLQGVYREGDIIDIEVLVTTHHKGHFVFSICPIMDTVPMEIPTEECFANNRLIFMKDELYGAPIDEQYPERAYIAPASVVQYTQATEGVQPVVGAQYKMKFKLPEGVSGNVVLLQWYYLTANSCKHEGYENYNFPEEWGSDVTLYPGLSDCGDIPEDGNGVPEQFWNCAEIRIVSKGGSTISSPMLDPNAVSEASASSSTTTTNTAAASEAAPPPPTSFPTPKQPCSSNSGSAAYYEATEDCSGYYICESGIQGETIYQCAGNDMLYDEVQQMCNWASEVNCLGLIEAEPTHDEFGNPLPTKAPTHSPTQKPNSLLEWDPDAHPRQHDKTIIGYYASWQWYDRNGLAEPAAFDFSKITRANFAFFQITPDGYIYGTDNWADPITLFGFYDWMAEEGSGVHEYCSWDAPNTPPTCMTHKYEEGLIYLAHQAGAEVYPSIGGWSLSDPFPVMAADAESRATFARQCVALIKSYNFDGIDLDWEYPGYEPHSGTPDDTVNFNLLLDDIRAALDALEAETGKYYGLTAALPCGPSIIDNQDIAHVGRLLTELNLMTYDFHGSWNENTGVNAPLYDQNDSPEFSVHGCVENWVEGGAPKEKINIGWPFYGRSFLKAQHLYEPHEGNDESLWWMDEGVPQYYNIMDKMDELTNVRDEQTMTQYAYGSTGMVSYDDERAICDKTEYAQVHGLNGYIIWELSGDLMPDLSTPLLDAGNAKLLNPDLDCASLDLSDLIKEVVSDVHPQSNTAGDAPGAETMPWYPDRSKNVCVSDGNEPSWLPDADLTSSIQECCTKHFSWSQTCLDDSAIESGSISAEDVYVFYPSSMTDECLSDGNEPSWMSKESFYKSAEDCCQAYYFYNTDCVAVSQANAGGSTASAATDSPPTPQPSLRKTNRPTSRNPTSVPTRHPVITNSPFKKATGNPTEQPVTPQPTRYPTPPPVTSEVMMISESTYPEAQASMYVQPTKRTKRPTQKPTTQAPAPIVPIIQQENSPVAEAFLGAAKDAFDSLQSTTSITMSSSSISSSSSSSRPIKGQEISQNIQAQIQPSSNQPIRPNQKTKTQSLMMQEKQALKRQKKIQAIAAKKAAKLKRLDALIAKKTAKKAQKMINPNTT